MKLTDRAKGRDCKIRVPMYCNFNPETSDTIIEQERLMQLTGAKQKAALRRHLRKAGIPFKEPNGRIFTTQEALDSVLVGRGKKKKIQPRWLRDSG